MPIKALSYRQRTKAPRYPDRTGTSASRGYDFAWQRLRKAWLQYHPACVFCTGPASEVDHIRPITAGAYPHDAENLRSVCHACHSRLTANHRRTGVNELPMPVAGHCVNAKTQSRRGLLSARPKSEDAAEAMAEASRGRVGGGKNFSMLP